MNFSDFLFTYEAGNSRAIQMRISDNFFERVFGQWFFKTPNMFSSFLFFVFFLYITREDFFIEIDCSSTRDNTESIFQWESIGILLDW